MVKSKVMLAALVLTIGSAASAQVCTQLVNQTGETLSFKEGGANYNVAAANGSASDVIVAADGAQYQLLDSSLAVYGGMPQIVAGGFNMTFGNYEIPAGMNCDVFYRISIYK